MLLFGRYKGYVKKIIKCSIWKEPYQRMKERKAIVYPERTILSIL